MNPLYQEKPSPERKERDAERKKKERKSNVPTIAGSAHRNWINVASVIDFKRRWQEEEN